MLLIIIKLSVKLAALPPEFPRKEIVFIFFFFANFKTSRIFFELPDVEKQINKSSLFASASNCLLNTLLKLKSFEQAVIKVLSTFRHMAGIPNLLYFLSNLTKNSVAICCASDAEPPLPHKNIFFFDLTFL